MFHSLRQSYSAGMSQRCIQKQLDKTLAHQILSSPFTNKPHPRPISARAPHERTQIDLMDMGAELGKSKKPQFWYILTVLAVFSRYVWFRPFCSKSSKSVARRLRKIYKIHGSPQFIQCDRGTEFMGHVNIFAKRNNMRIMRSRPCHPQSLGKVEHSHRILWKKITFDVHSSGRSLTSFKWVKRLSKYETAFNNEPKKASWLPYTIRGVFYQSTRSCIKNLKDKWDMLHTMFL